MSLDDQSIAKSRLAQSFSRLGWCGVWLQILVGAIPVGLMVYYFIFTRSPSGPRAGFRFVEYLAAANLLVLAFTTLWSYRYTRVARRIADSESGISDQAPLRTVWTGVTASVVGIAFSMLVMLIEVAHLLFYFLKAPQAGVPVIQTTVNGSASWVSAADMMSLMALTVTLLAEWIVLGLSLRLLYRATKVAVHSQG